MDPRTKTNETFKKEVFNLVGEEYTFLEEYKTNSVKLKCRHNSCKNTYTVSPIKFLSGRRCPFCAGRINTDIFKSKIFDLFGDKITILGEYLGRQSPILVRQNICKHEYETTPHLIYTCKGRCVTCNKRLSTRKTNETFKKEVFNLVGEEYTFLEKYKTKKISIEVIHNKCKNKYYVTPNSFLRGRRCPFCAGNRRYSTEEFSEKITKMTDGEYTLVDNYLTTHKKVKILHNNCKKIFEMRPSGFINGDRCPICNESKGERCISDWLNDRNISFEREFKFSDCKDVRSLPFDFKVGKTLIEFDGIQHFNPNFGSDSLKITQRHDSMKNKYCEKNKINLYRIHYSKIDKLDYILENIFLTSTTIPEMGVGPSGSEVSYIHYIGY